MVRNGEPDSVRYAGFTVHLATIDLPARDSRPPLPIPGLIAGSCMQIQHGILTTSCLCVLLCRTATHSSCRDPNPSTKRAYENAIGDFIRFTGIARPEEFRTVTRAHVIAWRDDLERREIGPATNKRTPEGATIRHRLAALSSLFEYLCEKNAVSHNAGPAYHRASANLRRRYGIGGVVIAAMARRSWMVFKTKRRLKRQAKAAR